MSTNITLKRSAVQGKVPLVGDLALGEIAVNTYDGKLYIKKNDGSESIVGVGDTNLGYTAAASTGTVTSSDGTDATLPAATTSLAGLLTGADKTKLNGIATGANLYVHPSDGVDLGAALTGANVISDVNVNTAGHVTGFATRALTLANLGYTGSPTADNYGGWTLETDSISRGTISSSEVVNFIGGTNINLAYNATDNAITIATIGSPTFVDVIADSFQVTGGTEIDEGIISWNDGDGTLDVTLKSGVVNQLGQEIHMYVRAATAISDGDVVYVSGVIGASGHIEVSKYIANNTIDELYVVGIATNNITLNEFGYITVFGAVRGVSTDGSAVGETWTEGTILYASPSTAGALTSTQPVAPNQDIPIAMVLSVNAVSGVLFVRAFTPGYHLDDLHDVFVDAVSTGEVLKWEGTRWINNTLAEAGIQPAGSYLTGNQTITLSGDLTGSGATSINAQLAANVVNANELNVVGNGTTAQYLRSDGDGTFTWATPTGTTYTGGDGLTLTGTDFDIDLSDTLIFTSTNTASRAVVRDGSGNFSAGTITAALSGNATTASAWATGRTITLTGDVTGVSASWTGSGNISFATTIAANSVALGTDTTGNYVATISGTTNEIEVTGSGSETAAVTIGLPNDVTITNDLIVGGNLTINGTTTTINSTTLQVDDKNIELGTVTTPTDITADGGGITLKGDTDKTITWSNATNTWDFNQDVKVDGDVTISGGTGAAKLSIIADSDNITETDTATIFLSQDGGIVTGQWGFDSINSMVFENFWSGGHVNFKTNGVGVVQANGNAVLTIATAFGGDVSGTYNNIVVSNDSHTHIAANITDFDTEVANNSAVVLNTAKVTNVSTNLTTTHNASTVVVNSSDGTNATINAATATTAGIMSEAIFDQHVLNNAKITNATHTGEVTGSTALTIASNVVDADNLNVVGNGTTAQYLRSDGDGSFTWATPTDTNTTYTAGTNMSLAGTVFSVVASPTFTTVTATDFNTTSDISLKENVVDIAGALNKVSRLRGVEFDWKATGVHTVGFIAQEVEEVVPELVATNIEDGIKSVKYSNVTALLVEAIKELSARIEELENK